MEERRTEGFRHRIENMFPNSGLIMLLLHSPLFSFFFFGFIAFIIFLALFLPKMWVQTPDGFDPVVKISGLDRVQAWSLSRSARKREAEGKFDEAILTWRMAAGNNLANPESVRGLLSATLLAEDRAKHASTVGQFSYWLLRITETNAADVRFVVETLDGHEMQDTGAQIMKGLGDALPDDLRPTFVKWLFDLGDYQAFSAAGLRTSRNRSVSIRSYRSTPMLGKQGGVMTRERPWLRKSVLMPPWLQIPLRRLCAFGWQ